MAWSLLKQVETHKGPIPAATLAEWLGVTPKSVYEMMKNGHIPVINDGYSAKRVDPHTYAHVLRKRNPIMRDAAKVA